VTVQMCEIEGCNTRAILALYVPSGGDCVEQWVCVHHALELGSGEVLVFLRSLGVLKVTK
jgi:hypothetical protein